MKKYIYFAALALTLSFTSCNDFLSVESPDELTSNNFWRNESDALAGLAAAYSQLYHGDMYATSEIRWPVEGFRTDLYNIGSDAGNYQEWVELYQFNYTNGNSAFSYYYQDLYRGINFANQVLNKVPEIPAGNISDEVRQTILGEAHFLRGYYHLMLLMNWEKIIIRDVYITKENELNKPLSERSAAWDFVIQELQAATNLPSKRTDDEMGRATSGAAWSYLGFAYLTRAYEETYKKTEYLNDALKAFENVKGYELVSGDQLIDMFNGSNKNCPESIFEVQYTKSETNGSVHYSFINQWIGASELGGWDEILPSTFLVNEYKKEGAEATTGRYDSRLYNTIYLRDPYFNDGSKRVIEQDYDERFKQEDGTVLDKPVFRKYTSTTKDAMQESCAFNVVLMRYANVLLLKAEVLNELGRTAEAIPIINEIRKVHGDMPAMKGVSQAEVRKQIEHERILEFPLESYRWYDLRRWGKIKPALDNVGRDGTAAEKHDFYPIPKWEVDANPSLNQ